MEEKYVALAIPFFFVLIGIELLVNRRRGDLAYSFQDSINNLSCGIGQQVLEPFLRTAGLAGYVLLYEHARLATIPASSVWGWAVLFLGVDLCYYAFHRASHRVNFLWASHVVHHHSEEYNLSVALRQSWIEVLLQPAFYLPLALVGFSPLMFVGMSTLNTLYQFWIHTRAVKRVPGLEWVLNTPSHHRVHHGVNPKYIDKNYAGVLIVWDRLFGTFQDEEEEPVYGTVKPLASWNPLWANAHYWVEMGQMARATSRVVDRLKVWFMPPEWRPADLSEGLGYVTIPEASRATQQKYAVTLSPALAAYVAVSFLTVAAATTAFLWLAHGASLGPMLACSALILTTLMVWGGLVEGRAWSVPLEIARLAGIVAFVAWALRASPQVASITAVVAVAAAALAAWVVRARPTVAAMALASSPAADATAPRVATVPGE